VSTLAREPLRETPGPSQLGMSLDGITASGTTDGDTTLSGVKVGVEATIAPREGTFRRRGVAPRQTRGIPRLGIPHLGKAGDLLPVLHVCASISSEL
jgi:hypothetical protein